MSPTGELVAQWEDALNRHVVGWDFSALSDHMREDPTPWDFAALSRDALRGAGAALDMGTGGGEELIRHLRAVGDDRPPHLVATEGWPPNVPVAQSNLAPHHVEVVVHDPESGERMPLGEASLDLVLNRHEAYVPAEVSRVLQPGGRFLTQQVGARDAAGVESWFGRGPRPPWSLEDAAAQLRLAGLTVIDGDEFVGAYRFDSVTTLLRYFARVPWDLPEGFTVRGRLAVLKRLHEAARSGPISLSQHRWYLVAQR